MGVIFLAREKIPCEVLACSEGLGVGYGVFETIAMGREKPIALPRHLNRLINSCEKIGIESPDRVELTLELEKWIETQKISSLNAIKLVAFKMGSESIIQFQSRANPYIDCLNMSFKLCKAQSIRDENAPLVSIKTTSYLHNLIERQVAMEKGFDECYFLNKKGYLSEGSFTNIFVEIDEKIFTPSLACGILPGISRQRILESSSHFYECDHLTEDDLKCASGVVVTNALMGAIPVDQIDQIKIDKSKSLAQKLILSLEKTT